MQLKAFNITALVLLVAVSLTLTQASVIRSADYDNEAFQPGFGDYDGEADLQQRGSRYHRTRPVVDYDGEVDMSQRARDERTRVRAQAGGTAPCPGCVRQEIEQELSAEALRELRIEMIKQQILENLRMDAPPNITAPRPVIPAPLLATMDKHTDYEAEQQALEEARTKTTEVATFATGVNNCMGDRPSACLTFNMKDALSPDEVHSAELWVYKLPDPIGSPYRNQSFIASSFDEDDNGDTTREQVDIEQTAAKRGWVKFNVRHLVKQWLHHPDVDHQVEVSCRDCFFDDDEVPIATKDELKPFIITYTTDMRRRRSKRAVIDCSPSTTTCCRERLYVNFAAIGWEWIAQPEGYWANFCKGSCTGIMLPTKHHTTIMQILRLVDPPNRATMCCAPSRLSALSILYYEQQDDDHTIIRREDMADMVVESCGCI